MNRPFSDALALASPSGRMSKRALKAAQERIRIELFGKEGMKQEPVPQPCDADTFRRQAKEYRELAARGMHPIKYSKLAEKCDILARIQENEDETIPNHC